MRFSWWGENRDDKKEGLINYSYTHYHVALFSLFCTQLICSSMDSRFVISYIDLHNKIPWLQFLKTGGVPLSYLRGEREGVGQVEECVQSLRIWTHRKLFHGCCLLLFPLLFCYTWVLGHSVCFVLFTLLLYLGARPFWAHDI
jgi:hypothetical protein